MNKGIKFVQQFCESGLIKMNADPNQIAFTTQRFHIVEPTSYPL